MNRWRLLDTGALPGAMNMAIDQALLRLHEQGESAPTLRLYRWSPPAVSLGYFQRRPGLDPAACRGLGVDVVRRPTGGRAVLHLNDLTYSVVAGIREGMPSSPATAYRLLCEGLMEGFKLLGIEAEMGRERVKPPQPDVCFLRAATADIVHRGRKFVGSAQTWRGESLLQHGSIVLAPQTQALAAVFGASPEELGRRITSVGEVLGRRVEAAEVGEAIRHGLGRVLGVVFEAGELSAEEWVLARQIADQEGALPCPAKTTAASLSAA
jgi:lipoate-protein ligase A